MVVMGNLNDFDVFFARCSTIQTVLGISDDLTFGQTSLQKVSPTTTNTYNFTAVLTIYRTLLPHALCLSPNTTFMMSACRI